MKDTPFAGLTELEENDPITIDGAGFLTRNPVVTDTLLRVGAVTHRHDAHPALPTPHVGLSGFASPTGGQIAASGQFALTYTIVDAQGGETLPATPLFISTGPQVGTPTIAPSAVPDYTGGIMPAGSYYYAKTLTDGAGGETPISPSVFVYVDPGFASASVDLSALDWDVPVGGAWRLWRSYEGADWHLVTEGTSNTFVDAGFDPPDNPALPPEQDTTNSQARLTVTIPSVGSEPALGSGVAINLYMAPDAGFADPCFYAQYPIASAGATFAITQETVNSGRPPRVATAKPGAAKINPDTDILDWHWKRPVATVGDLPSAGNEEGDARVVFASHDIYVWTGTSWVDKSGGGGGGGSGGVSDPLGPALGVMRVTGPSTSLPAHTTTNVTIPVPSWAEANVGRIVLAVCLAHPDVGQTSAQLIDPASDPADVWPASAYAGANRLGYPPGGTADPDDYLYFNDFALGQVNYSGGWTATPIADVGASPPTTGVVRPKQGFTSWLLGDAIAGNWTLAIDNLSASAGTLDGVVLYFISNEFDGLAMMPAPPPARTDWLFTGNGSATVFTAATSDGLGEYSSVSLWQEVLATVGGTFVYATEVAPSTYDVARVEALDASGAGVRITMHTAPAVGAQYTVHAGP